MYASVARSKTKPHNRREEWGSDDREEQRAPFKNATDKLAIMNLQ
jgi:hypothetical protein